MTEYVTVDQVKAALGIPPYDTLDDEWLELCVAGVNQFVTDTREDPAAAPEGRVTWGAVQLATRWYSRRNSTEVSAFVELGGPPPSIDRDIEVALEVGRHFRPAVA
jgi:hypothetical protein